MLLLDYCRVLKYKIAFPKGFKCSKFVRFKALTHINAKKGTIIIGKRVACQTNVHLTAVNGAKLVIGDGVSFNRNCIIVCRQHIEIGEGTVFGPNVCAFDHNHCFNTNGVMETIKAGSIIIGKKCWIGAGAIILNNTTIGDGCVINNKRFLYIIHIILF